jgi:hypothetical protein
MTSPIQFDFIAEPRGENYRRLLYAGLDFSQRGILVTPARVLADESYQESLERMDLEIIDVVDQSEWPGTQLLDGVAKVHHFVFDYLAYEKLTSVVDALYDWILPSFPEDLCLLREDKSPWLISVTHEKDAWLALQSEELAHLKTKHPAVIDQLVPQ